MGGLPFGAEPPPMIMGPPPPEGCRMKSLDSPLAEASPARTAFRLGRFGVGRVVTVVTEGL